MTDRKWDSTNETILRKCLDEVITRIEDIDTDAAVGVIAAQDVVDIVLENLAPEIYNNGVEDAKKLIASKLPDIEVELDLLKQSS